MNISEILKKILLEDETNPTKSSRTTDPPGLDWNNQYSILEGVLGNCSKYSKLVEDKRRIKELKEEDKAFFPEVSKSPTTDIRYVTGDFGGDFYMIFGMKDPKAPEGTTQLLAYRVLKGQNPEYIPSGMASDCAQLQALNQIGVFGLSEINRAQLSAWTESVGASNVRMEEPENIDQYERKPYKALIWPTTGQKVFDPMPTQEGYVWIKRGLKQKLADVIGNLETYLNSNGFTADQRSLKPNSDSLKYRLYVEDTTNEFEDLNTQVDSYNKKDIIYPVEGFFSGVTRENCRNIIKKLHTCLMKSDTLGCGEDLLKNKITALPCQNPEGRVDKYLKGPLGVGDELEKLLTNGGKYGLSEIKRKVGTATYGPVAQKESINKKINRVLNEEYKKFKF